MASNIHLPMLCEILSSYLVVFWPPKNSMLITNLHYDMQIIRQPYKHFRSRGSPVLPMKKSSKILKKTNKTNISFQSEASSSICIHNLTGNDVTKSSMPGLMSIHTKYTCYVNQVHEVTVQKDKSGKPFWMFENWCDVHRISSDQQVLRRVRIQPSTSALTYISTIFSTFNLF